MRVLVIVEGGGSSRADQAPLREAFSNLLAKIRPKPKAEVCCAGSRNEAFGDFERKLKQSVGTTRSLLLVDSEGPVNGAPWAHVNATDGWEKPAKATDDDLHFMVQMTEAWLLSDPSALGEYYGAGFKPAKIPKWPSIEAIPKAKLLDALEGATKDAKPKGRYRKAHAFDLVGQLDPAKVRKACPAFADRFFKELENA